jgi:hypothetical protein
MVNQRLMKIFFFKQGSVTFESLDKLGKMKRKKLDLTRCSQDQKRQKHTKGKKNNEDPNIEEFFFLERSSQKTKLIKCRKRVSILSCKLQKHLNRLRIRTTNRMSSVNAIKTIFLI